MSEEPLSWMHMGRSFEGHALEDRCGCPQAPCGLVPSPGSRDDCKEHGISYSRTMRQMHKADECPAKLDRARPTPKVFMDRDALHYILIWVTTSESFQSDHLTQEKCGYLRDAAERLGLDPNEYTPVRNRYMFKHKWDPLYEDGLCDWCKRDFKHGAH